MGDWLPSISALRQQNLDVIPSLATYATSAAIQLELGIQGATVMRQLATITSRSTCGLTSRPGRNLPEIGCHRR
jgi:hypothetical protein